MDMSTLLLPEVIFGDLCKCEDFSPGEWGGGVRVSESGEVICQSELLNFYCAALNAGRSSHDKGVRLSVRLSNACIVTKRKQNLSRFLYHTKDHGLVTCWHYLLLEYGEPVDFMEPVMILDVVDSVDEIAIATCEVLLDHVFEQVAQIAREELGKLKLQHQ